jgi:hypothetical protein
MTKWTFASLPFIFLFALLSCKEQEVPNWINLSNDIDSIIVYHIYFGENDKLPTIMELKNAECAKLDLKLFKDILPTIKFRKSSVLWKGGLLSKVYLNNGNIMDLAISHYGSFFKVVGIQGYFYFDGENIEKFNKIYYEDILKKAFLPKR